MTQPRRPAGTPVGGQFAPTSRPEASGIELVDDDLPSDYENLVVDGGDRGAGRIMAFVEDPGGDGRDRWTVRFINGEEQCDYVDQFELLEGEDGTPISRERTEVEIVAARRAHTLRALAEDVYFDDPGSLENICDDVCRYLLVERSVIGGGTFWTTWDSLEDAGSYHVDQECPEDWDVKYVLDLDTGERFHPVVTMGWGPDHIDERDAS